MNPATLIDGYKFSHRAQYPDNTTYVYSNWTPRGSRVEGQTEETFFGLQYFLQKYLIEEWNEKFFNKPEEEVVAKYARRLNSYLGPGNNVGTDHIRDLHRLGYLPLEFKAIPEGTKVPMRVPTMTVENTLPEFFWLTNYFETLLSCEMWLPCTSATTARYFRDELIKGAVATGSPVEFVDWQGHDFSMRGMEGVEAAALSSAGHLLYFTGTDTVPALDLIEDYYGVPEGYLIGGSVPATEHSVACSWAGDCTGKIVDESSYFNHLLDIYPTGIVSAVSDTYNLWNVLTVTLPKLRDRIMPRNGKLVIRPDSGDPVDIICGDPKAPSDSPEFKGVIELLWDVFGGTKTSTGHKSLDQHIGCIYGDSITKDRARAIWSRLAAKGFASANIVFGIGSFTYQFVTRDTLGHAMKATHATINGNGINIFKTPITDNGLKNSAKGRLSVMRDANGDIKLIEMATLDQEAHSMLRLVWKNGQFVVKETYDIIRARARN